MNISRWLMVALIASIPGLNACVKDLESLAVSKGRKPVSPPKSQANKKTTPPAATSRWKSFKDDSLHDMDNPALANLQQPSEALASLPKDSAGNYVNWVKALTEGHISPRTNIYEETKINVIDLDIYMDLNGSLPVVRFPHREHTMWLDCENCHEKIFKYKAGETKFSMTDILNGKFCGQCHGAVAFPLTECRRCHSVPHAEFRKLRKTKSLKVSGK